MPYSAPGVDDDRVKWILVETRKAQNTLDSRIAEAQSLPDTEPSKIERIKRLNAMKREVDQAYVDLDTQVATWASQDVRSMYRQGHAQAAAQTSSGYDFTLPHREALDLISRDAYDDVATRLQQVRSGFSGKVELQKMYEGLSPEQIASIQTSSRSAVAQMLLTGTDPRKISKVLAQDIWSQGISIIDAGGNHWNPEKYTRMLIRTKSANAYNSGSLNKFTEEGVTRVQVFDGVKDDEECANANGQIWSLRYAMNHVISHPNCRRAFGPVLGEGPVQKDTIQKYTVIFDRVTLAFGALTALRAFRNRGEVNVSSTLARLIIEMAEAFTVPIPVVDSFVQGLVSGTFVELDAWIGSYIDPVLYASGIIRNIPSRVALQATLRSDNFVDEITNAIIAANREAFGTEFHPQVRAVVDALDRAVARGTAFLVPGEGKGGMRWIDPVITALNTERYGEITAEVLRTVQAGDVETLRKTWAEATSYVDALKEAKRDYVRIVVGSSEQAQEIYLKYEEILSQLSKFAQEAAVEPGAANLPAALDFIQRYARHHPEIEVEALISYFESTVGLNFTATQVRHMREIFDAALEVQQRALSRIEDADMFLLRQNGRELAMAAPSGPDFPTEIRTLWDVDEYEATVSRVAAAVEAALSGGVSSMDEKMVISIQELFRMLTFEVPGATTDAARFPFYDDFYQHFKPKWSSNLAGYVDPGEMDEPGKAFVVWFGVLEGLEFERTTGKLLLHSDPVDDHTLSQIVEILKWFDSDDYFISGMYRPLMAQHWMPQFMRQHIGNQQAVENELLASLFRKFLVDLRRYDPQAISQPFQNIHTILAKAFTASNVSWLGKKGINGTPIAVTDPATGMKVVVKRQTSRHTSGANSYIPSFVWNEVLGRRLGDVEVLPTRFVSAGGRDDEIISIAPFFDGDNWKEVPKDLIRDDSTRRFSLFDRLAMERDNHAENIMINQYTQTSVSIDREMSGILYLGPSIANDIPDAGMFGISNYHHLERQVAAWLDGDDLDFLGNDPGVVLAELNRAEVQLLTGKGIQEIKDGFKFGTLGHTIDFLNTGVIVTADGRGFIPTGRIGLVDWGAGGGESWHAAHFLTETELQFVRDIMVPIDSGNNEMYDEIQEMLLDIVGGMGEATREEFIRGWTRGQGDITDAVEAAAFKIVGQVQVRVQNLFAGGVLNTLGSVSKHVSDTGQDLRYGEVVKFVHKASGEEVTGLVVNLYENVLDTDEVAATIIPHFGTKKTLQQLETLSTRPRKIRLDEWSWGETFVETPEGISAESREVVRSFKRNTDPDLFGDPRQRVAPVINAQGLIVGYREEQVVVDASSGLAGRVTIADREGNEVTLGLTDFVHSAVFREILDEELQSIPLEFKPRIIKPTLERLTTSDGKPAFGFFDESTGTLRISLLSMFNNGHLTLEPGRSSAWRYRVDGNLRELQGASMEEVIRWKNRYVIESLTDDEFINVVRHELGHAVGVGTERQFLNRAAVEVFDQFRGQAPGMGMDQLENLADSLVTRSVLSGSVPEGFDPDGYPSKIAALIALRVGILEDVANTNLAVMAREIMDGGLRSKNAPPWWQAVYAGVLREEPEAHHELFAELWRQVIEEGGSDRAVATVAQRFDINQQMLADYFLRRNITIELPAKWDLASPEFIEWLTTTLRPGADRIIPLDRNANRRLWRAERYSIPDIRKKVLHTPFEEGGGGITINLVTGEEPTEGFSVAKKANERIVENVTDENFDEVFRQYVKDHKKDLQQPEWELGMWVDEDGVLYLDTVKVFDDEVNAAVFGFREQQRAMYDLNIKDGRNLLDDHDDIYGYLKARKIEMPYNELLARVEKIGGVSRRTGEGAKILEDVFEKGGSFKVMSLEWMTPAHQEKVLKTLADRYTVAITVEEGKKNLEDMLKRGVKLFKEQPELEEKFRDFYFFWRKTFIDAAAETAQRPVPITVEKIAAAAASMSASLDADVNLVTVVNIVDVLSRDLVVTPAHARETRILIQRSIEDTLKRAAKAAPAKAIKELAYAAELGALLRRARAGGRLNALEPRLRMRMVAGVISSEGRQKVQVPRAWGFYEKSVAVLLGEIPPGQALTDTKFRPFYNNILDPEDLFNTREVTIDFVMANVFFMVVGMNDLNHITPVVNGISAGLRPIISDTLRELFDEGWGERLGLTSVSQMQSLIWNLFRYGQDNEWFPDLPRIELRPSS